MESNIVYVNSASVALTRFDGTLSFSTTTPKRDDTGNITGMNFSNKTEVIMSLEHLKLFASILNAQIAEFEKKEFIIPEIRMDESAE